MRTLTAGLFHSVDGVVESPDQWQFDSFDAELGESMGTMISRVDCVVLGRVGYEQWSQYWPTADDGDFGPFINTVSKHVASRTLTGPLAWQNSSLIEGDLNEFVSDLKKSEGGDIAVMGGISIVRHLFFAGLLDGLILMTHPVIAGSGRKFFEAGDPVTRLTLRSSTVTSSGNLVSEYTRQ